MRLDQAIKISYKLGVTFNHKQWPDVYKLRASYTAYNTLKPYPDGQVMACSMSKAVSSKWYINWNETPWYRKVMALCFTFFGA